MHVWGCWSHDADRGYRGSRVSQLVEGRLHNRGLCRVLGYARKRTGGKKKEGMDAGSTSRGWSREELDGTEKKTERTSGTSEQKRHFQFNMHYATTTSLLHLLLLVITCKGAMHVNQSTETTEKI